MALTIEPHEGRWVVLQDGVPVFSGDYRQVEDWLDQAENSASGEQQADEPAEASGPMLRIRGHGGARVLPARSGLGRRSVEPLDSGSDRRHLGFDLLELG